MGQQNTGVAWRVKQLDDETLAYLVPDAKPRTNAGKMSATVVIASEIPDRDGDLVLTDGIDMGDHRRNPIVCLAHQRKLVAGLAEDPLGAYTVRRVGKQLEATTYFNKSSRLGEEAFRLVDEKIFRGASMGWPAATMIVTKRVNMDNGWEGRLFKRVRPLEYSHLPDASNPDCLVRVVEKGFGGRKLCDPLYDYLLPLIPERPPVVTSGFDGTVRKAMPDSRDTLQGAAAPEAADPMAPPTGGDQNADPNAADPNAAGGHKETVDNAVADMMASWYMQLCDGIIDEKKFIDKMTHLAETRSVHIDAGGDEGDVDGEEDLSADDEDADLDPDDADDDSDSPSPDLEDEDKKKAEKACLAVWEKSYQPTMARVAMGLGHVAAYPDLCPTKAQAYVRKLLGRMEALPGIDETVRKALAGGISPAASAALAEAAAGPLYTALLQVQAQQDQVMARLDEQDSRLRAVTG